MPSDAITSATVKAFNDINRGILICVGYCFGLVRTISLEGYTNVSVCSVGNRLAGQVRSPLTANELNLIIIVGFVQIFSNCS